MGWERLRGSNGGVIRFAVAAIAAVPAIVPPAVALQTAAAATSATSTPATSATPAPVQEPLAGLDAYIRESMPDWDVPGLAVAVVYNDEVVFARGFGVKELGRDDPVDAHTLFQIGSVTKSFAAGAIGALVDDGLVSWDDPVVKHLPWFRVRDPWVTREMTIRDLLSHRSGMPGDAYPVLAVMDARQAAERLRLPDNQAPLRQGFRYSNQAYGVAGLVVEAVTGTSWGDWVRERLLLPLEMHESVTSPYDVWDDPHVASTFLGVAPAGRVGIDDAPGRNVAMPHGVGRDGERRVLPWQSYDNMQAAGSVVSNVADLANWMRMHIRQGLFNGEFVLEDSTVSEMQAPQIATEHTFAFADDHTGSYGMGWTRATFHDHLYLFHGGGIFGFPAYAAMLPGIGAGVVVLANGSMWTPYYPHQEIAAWVFAQLLGVEPRDWHGEIKDRTGIIHSQVEAALAAQDTARIPGTRPSLSLEDYAGTYEDAYGSGPVTVVLSDGGLRLHFDGAGAFSGEMEHWHHDVYRLYFDGGDGQAYGSSFVTFTIGLDGGIARMDLGFMGQFRRTG